jgi:hypothetical protein
MSDAAVRGYLYLLLISSIVFLVLWIINWLATRPRGHSLSLTRVLLHNIFILVSGLVGFCLFFWRSLEQSAHHGTDLGDNLREGLLTEGIIKLTSDSDVLVARWCLDWETVAWHFTKKLRPDKNRSCSCHRPR